MTRQIVAHVDDDTFASLKLIAARQRLGGVEAAASEAISAYVALGGSTEAAAVRALLSSVEDSQRVIADFVASVLSADAGNV